MKDREMADLNFLEILISISIQQNIKVQAKWQQHVSDRKKDDKRCH